jgi:hypothetical protein
MSTGRACCRQGLGVLVGGPGQGRVGACEARARLDGSSVTAWHANLNPQSAGAWQVVFGELSQMPWSCRSWRWLCGHVAGMGGGPSIAQVFATHSQVRRGTSCRTPPTTCRCRMGWVCGRFGSHTCTVIMLKPCGCCATVLPAVQAEQDAHSC